MYNLKKIAQLRCLALRRPHRGGEAFADLGKKFGAFYLDGMTWFYIFIIG